MIKVAVLAVIFVSAYAEVSKEERERIGSYLIEKATELSFKKVQEEEFFNSNVDEIVKSSGKSGDCVNEAIQNWKSEGNKLIESAYTSPIMELRNSANQCPTLDEKRMEVLIVDVDSGNLDYELSELEERVEIEIQKTIESFKEAIESCQ